MTNALKSALLMLFWLPALAGTLSRNWLGHYYIFRDSPDDFLKYLSWLETVDTCWGDDMERYFLRASDERQRRAIVKRSRA